MVFGTRSWSAALAAADIQMTKRHCRVMPGASSL
jgi:hypothetical protein